jgi:hypothetical protein
MKSKWVKDAEAANAKLAETHKAFSRAGLYLTSLLLAEVKRVGEYEMHTEIAKSKEYRKKKGKK